MLQNCKAAFPAQIQRGQGLKTYSDYNHLNISDSNNYGTQECEQINF